MRKKLRRAVLVAAASLFVGGLAASVFIAWVIAYLKTEPTAGSVSIAAIVGDESRHIEISGNRVMERATLTGTRGLNWGPHRATGAPDTNQMGDIPTAWASDTPDGKPEWLELDYAQPMVPQVIHVRETNAPGALNRVTIFDASNQEIEVWRGSDPAAPNQSGIWIANVNVNVTIATSRIRLYLDSVNVRGWNEIDAVALVDADRNLHWATNARASSTYALRGTFMTFDQLNDVMPRWIPRKSTGGGSATFEAYGWPLLTVWMRVDTTAATGRVPLPLRPIWIGLLVNGMIYGVMLGLLYLSTFKLRKFVRESLWLRRGCCMRCGYDLRFDLARGCPECGWRREETAVAAK
jgi:hypothetical protein